MTYTEAVDYLSSTEWFRKAPGLEHMYALLEMLGNPQDKLKFIHIAGTNGKGSCAAMTASVLKTCGYKTGLFTSPYLFRFNERMQINGEQLDDSVLVSIVEQLAPIAEAMEVHPTAFELMTACAMKWFADERCDIVVLEAGLGGKYDSTNVISSPLVSVIMNIGLDHTQVLGDTIEKIAAEKAGIIKSGCDCVLYEQSASVADIVRSRCEEVGARLHIADFSSVSSEFDSLEGQVFSYKNQPYALPLLGEHQLKNASVVLEIIELLRKRGMRLEQSEVEHGLYSVAWPGRFELVSDNPYFIVDGGHNPQCAGTVADNLLRYFPDNRRVLLIGLLADKDYRSLLDILAPVADEFICITPPSPRALPAEELAAELRRFDKPVAVCGSVEEGVAAAVDSCRKSCGMVCAVGSLYSVGRIRACFNLY